MILILTLLLCQSDPFERIAMIQAAQVKQDRVEQHQREQQAEADRREDRAATAALIPLLREHAAYCAMSGVSYKDLTKRKELKRALKRELKALR
jgi:hypothetical protein